MTDFLTTKIEGLKAGAEIGFNCAKSEEDADGMLIYANRISAYDDVLALLREGAGTPEAVVWQVVDERTLGDKETGYAGVPYFERDAAERDAKRHNEFNGEALRKWRPFTVIPLYRALPGAPAVTEARFNAAHDAYEKELQRQFDQGDIPCDRAACLRAALTAALEAR